MSCNRDGALGRTLWTWDASEPTPREIFSADSIRRYDLAWSPSGDRFGFHARHQGLALRTLFEARFPDGTIEAIDDDANRWSNNNHDRPEPWSPDGRAYFFGRHDETMRVRFVPEASQQAVAGGDGMRVSGMAWQRAPLAAQ